MQEDMHACLIRLKAAIANLLVMQEWSALRPRQENTFNMGYIAVCSSGPKLNLLPVYISLDGLECARQHM